MPVGYCWRCNHYEPVSRWFLGYHVLDSRLAPAGWESRAVRLGRRDGLGLARRWLATAGPVWPEHVWHCDPRRPVLVGCVPAWSCGEWSWSQVLMDGQHRAARFLRLGDWLPVALLTPAETLAARTGGEGGWPVVSPVAGLLRPVLPETAGGDR